ncbi:MAG: cell division protein FtsK [Alphaproteobacteria bacterium]|nr:cell division protein FtsK [Alphaproteobacteria bacterium]
MASPTRNAPKTRFLPPAASRFLRRRLTEAAGLLLAAAGLAIAAALASYNAADPSINVANAGTAQNWLGAPGAWTADILMQTMGVAGWIAAAVLIVWGWRVGLRRPMGRAWLRITALPACLLLTAVALAALPVPQGWPLEAGLGGITGQMLLGRAAEAIPPGYQPGMLVALIAAPLALAALVTTLGVTLAEWRRLGAATFRLGVRGAAQGGRYGLRAGRWAATAARGAGDGGGRREPKLSAPRLEPGRRKAPAADAPEPAAQPRAAARREIVADRPPATRPGKRAEAARQKALEFDSGDYRLPELELLHEIAAAQRNAIPSEEALAENARLLESVLDDFGVQGEVVKVRPGPVVTLYEFEPAPGTKSSRVIGLADDIARSMSAVSVRVAVIPGRSVMGIELPNADRETVSLRELLASEDYERSGAKLPLTLGKEIGGEAVIADLSRMPHLLVAGTTGSGKSVAVNAMILSLLYRLSPEECRLIMIDPKMLELSVYDGIPHLLSPVVTDPSKAVVALRWTVREMETRYRNMSNLGVRNIAGYNARLEQARKKGEILNRTVQTGFDPETGEPIYEEQALSMDPLPYIVVVVDEMADLMLVAGKDVESSVQRIAQMARAAGIHLIMATQRPSVDVITGTIKANFPTRISFQVTSKIDSRTILGEAGAEQLLGQGDMLYMAGGGKVTRVHGPLVTDEEVERVVAFLKDQGEPTYEEAVTEDEQGSFGMPGAGGAGGGGGDDALYDQAVAVVCRERKASTSFVQRHLQIGYNRAARMIERMEAEGVISGANHAGKREVLARDIEGRD